MFRQKRIQLLGIGSGILFVFALAYSLHLYTKNSNIDTKKLENKVYQIGEQEIIVRNTTKNVQTSINLSAKDGDLLIPFTPHHLIFTNDKKYILVTITAPERQVQEIVNAYTEKTQREQHVMMATDQIIVINTENDQITKRIPIGVNQGLADIALASDGKYIYVTVEKGNAIYKINNKSYQTDLIQLPNGSNPHEIAISADATKIYTRNPVKKVVYLTSALTKQSDQVTETTELENLTWSKH